MDTFEPPKYLSSLIAAVNDGAKAAQTGAFAFALVGLYLLATAFSASDEDLLLDRTLAISQLGAQIPVTVSFAMMPVLFVALHVFTLIRYDMLAANVRHFRKTLETTVPLAADREHCRQLLANVEYVQSLTAPPGSTLHSRLFGFVAWVVIAGFPLAVLLAVQTNSLRYQSEIVTTVQRMCLLTDLAALVWFQGRQASLGRSPGAVIVNLLCWGVPVIVVLVNVAWLNIRGSKVDLVVGQYTAIFGQPLDHLLCPDLHWGCRFLRVDHRTLVGKVWDKKAIVEFGAGQPLTNERRASLEGVFLRDRSLRFAELSESRLYAADMISADLRWANLTGANLTGATLYGANLTGATLYGANLTGADLINANLINANLNDANLTGAKLTNANLTGASLGAAPLNGANLNGAKLTGAHLNGAHLNGAYLIDANLIGANLPHAYLTAANLGNANLNGANLKDTDLAGAYLGAANLINANLINANLTAAHLNNANLNGANLTGANLKYTDLSGADLGNGKGLTQAQLDAACGKARTLPLDPPGLILDRPCPTTNWNSQSR